MHACDGNGDGIGSVVDKLGEEMLEAGRDVTVEVKLAANGRGDRGLGHVVVGELEVVEMTRGDDRI